MPTHGWRPVGLSLLLLVGLACSDSTTGPNRPPVAQAGADRLVAVGQGVVLDGSGSFDPDGDALIYRWKLLVTPPASQTGLQQADRVRAEITCDRPGLYLVELTVDDGRLRSLPDLVRLQAASDTCSADEQCPPCHYCGASGSCQPHPAGSDPRRDCDDTVFCNGQETCDGQGGCQSGQQPCAPPLQCDETNRRCLGCSGDDDCPLCQVCQGGDCLPAATGADPKQECPAGPCRPGACDGQGACRVAAEGAACDDANPCTLDDSCHDGQCQGIAKTAVAEPRGCDDGKVCTDDSCDLADGSCRHLAHQGPCDDGAECSGNDTCQPDGSCRGEPDDGPCQQVDGAARCRPDCSPDASGCLVEPDELVLLCPATAVAQAGADCTLQPRFLGQPVAVDPGCLECTGAVGITTVEFTDFASGGECSLDGWQLLDGDRCSDDVTSCRPGGTTEGCATGDWCNTYDFGQPVLRAEQSRLSGGHHEQLRLHKRFDTRGLQNLNICFSYGELAASSDSGLLVYAYDDDHPFAADRPLYCKNDGPREVLDGVLVRSCLPLPEFAADNPDLEIMFILHSDHDNEFVFLDDIEIFGWGGGCQASRQTVLAEDFDDCQLPDWANHYDLNWCLDEPWCPGDQQCQGAGNLWAEGNSWCIYNEYLDASQVDERLELCFQVADWAANDEYEFSYLSLYNTDGDSWTMWQAAGDLGADGDCFTVCVDAGRRAPELLNNPAVGLFVSAGSGLSGQAVMLDDLQLAGYRFCQDSPALVFAEVVPQGQDGYHFGVTASGRLTAHLQCRYGGSGLSSNRVTLEFSAD